MKVLLCAFILHALAQCQGQYFGDLDASAEDFYRQHYWNWRSSFGAGGEVWPPRLARRQQPGPTTTERDREPLGPDYKDPDAGAGVIDVDVDGFPPGFPDNSPFPDLAPRYPGFSFLSAIRAQKPWWNGPNVCVEREETIEDEDNKKDDEDPTTAFLASINLSSCSETDNKYECVTKSNNRGVIKTFVVKYKCCYGYKRMKGEPGCVQVELKDLPQTIKDLECKEFGNMIENVGLVPKIMESNFTIFVPLDKAFNEFTEKMFEMNQIDIEVEPSRRKRDLHNVLSSKDLILNHMMQGFVDISDVENEQVLNSEFKNSTIRMNIFPTASGEKLLTANCVPIRKPNNLASNGIVHVIDGVITPGQYPIKQIIAESQKLTMLKKVFSDPEISKILDQKVPFTLLAPTNEAFDKLDLKTKEKILSGDSCALNILKHHIIPHTVCSPAINGNVTTHNIEGDMFNLERTEDDELIVENAKIVKSDIMATDGVIHFIDTILLPNSGLHVTQALKKQNLTKFERLIEDAGLVTELDDLNNATVFAPNDEAFSPETEKALDELRSNVDKLKEVVLYHVVPARMPSCELDNDALKETLADGDKLRVNLYSTLPLFTNIINRGTVNCARLVKFDQKSCGSLIHTVDKVLIPPSKNILEIVESEEKYSILRKVISDTEIEKILKNDESITLLAPTNDIFEKLDEKQLNMLLDNKEKAAEIMKHHILTEVLCCSGVGPQTFDFDSFIPSFARDSKEIHRNHRHQVRIGDTTVTKCDTMATNGVVHAVNKVMLPVKTPNIPGFGLFLFNF